MGFCCKDLNFIMKPPEVKQSNSPNENSFKQDTYLHFELRNPAQMFNNKTLPTMVDKNSFVIRFGSNNFLSARIIIRIHEV